MSLIPRSFLNAVVAIGIDIVYEEKTTRHWIASGFLVSLPEPNNSNYSTVYLITNKHVFENVKLVYIRLNSFNGELVRDYPIPLIDEFGHRLYTEHPKDAVDIVAMQINPNQLNKDGAIWSAFDLDNAALNLSKMMITGVDEGSMVYSLGFPMNLVDAYKTPVCRYGCISRITDAFLNPDKADHYLVDVHSFPGNSGGPIINKPENIFLQGTYCNSTANLVGILSKNIQYQEVLVSQQTQQMRMIQSENSGLTIVHPVDRIREVVILDWERHRIHIEMVDKTNAMDNSDVVKETDIPEINSESGLSGSKQKEDEKSVDNDNTSDAI